MKYLKLERTYLPDKTTGILRSSMGIVIDETLERPWKNNQRSISCIPAGIYKVRRDRTGRFQWYKVLGVQGRTAIEFHEGSKVEHSEGCILMSKEGLLKLVGFLNMDEEFILEISSKTS